MATSDAVGMIAMALGGGAGSLAGGLIVEWISGAFPRSGGLDMRAVIEAILTKAGHKIRR